MITITKERLLTIKQWRETYGPGSNVVLPAEEAEELARIALASLEAEPIGFRCRRNDNLGDWSYVYHREPDDFERKHLVIEGIYAAPPAPVVPEEMYWQDAPVEGSSKAAAYATGWNDCREAMLQSGNFRENKDSSTNNFRKIPEASTSSPVTPDGWISCSDRIPEMGERQYYVLAADFKNNYPPSIPNTQVGVYGDWFNDGNPTWDDGDGEDLHLKEVTHWMPLPEPPQEVK
ncbi:DUF551 domain-containing protein [Escherichia coli]|uniref:DUF551 domain-containing protein n=1 Tax=Escherichia coli TaxID=562 RepID=UPI00247CF69C|nr:DUF551 domain-containing protein [Escherichia coli]MDH7296801.1 DUF551 domain-containing protein [Escherichia coli]